MRGNPLLRTVFLAVALALTGALVAAVLRNGQGPTATSSPAPLPALTSALVPTYLTLSFSAPASSLTLKEPGGRIITIPVSDSLTVEYETELAISNDSYHATLTINWRDPAGPKFLHLELEPDNLPTKELSLHLKSTNHRLHLDFAN